MDEALNLIKAYFDPHIKTTLDDWKHCQSYFRFVEHKQGAIIKTPGSREEYLRFIIKGTGVILSRPKDKVDCVDISLEHDFLSDFISIIKEEPTEYYIKCIKAVKVVVVSTDRLLKIYQDSFLGGALGRVLSERQYEKKEMRRELNTGTTNERYQRLLTEHGELLQAVGQDYLASYIGMSVQSFRRARGRRPGGGGL